MKKTLNKLFNHEQLTYNEALTIMLNMVTGAYNNSDIASFLTVYLMRNISVNELAGFRDALLELCIKVDLSEHNTIDLCGTGGDEKDTFNISTLSSFVVAGAGYKVAKHGNYGVSSGCGSSNVLEYLGCEFSNNKDKIKREIDKANITFLHAPLFHPAIKYVASVRRELKQKTFFNMLGPLVNPSFPQNQVIGVYSLEVVKVYSFLLQKLDKTYSIIHSIDGYDEISLTGDAKVISNKSEDIISPEYFGFNKLNAEQIVGGRNIKTSSKIFIDVLKNKATNEQKNVVLANSAIAIKTIKQKSKIEDCIEEAKFSIESGKALKSLKIFLDK